MASGLGSKVSAVMTPELVRRRRRALTSSRIVSCCCGFLSQYMRRKNMHSME